jgi:hypothetical protein
MGNYARSTGDEHRIAARCRGSFRLETSRRSDTTMAENNPIDKALPSGNEIGTSQRSERHHDELAGQGRPEPSDEAMDQEPEQPSTSAEFSEGASVRSEPEPWDKVSVIIAALQKQRLELKVKAKAAAKEMKKAQREKRRTAKNAKKLSDDELIQIVLQRQVSHRVAAHAAASASRPNTNSSATKLDKSNGHE